VFKGLLGWTGLLKEQTNLGFSDLFTGGGEERKEINQRKKG
jgi:hypothetical protein